MTIVGVDGCPAGWIAALIRGDDQLELVLCGDFAEITLLDARIIAIDIPIGLLGQPVTGGRTCDREARKLLASRHSCVFSPPARIALDARTYNEARNFSLTRQSFGILPKIKDVDAVMTPELQRRIHESHPELAFRSMVGRPMQFRKKTQAGRDERLSALGQIKHPRALRTTCSSFAAHCHKFHREDVGKDDIIDAYAMAWVAWRISQGSDERVPREAVVDDRGLRMEIRF